MFVSYIYIIKDIIKVWCSLNTIFDENKVYFYLMIDSVKYRITAVILLIPCEKYFSRTSKAKVTKRIDRIEVM